MAAATLTFPSQTLLKNIVDPVDGTDAATKEYVDNAISGGGGGNLGAKGNTFDIQFNNSGNLAGSDNFKFDSANGLLTLVGNANLGNLVTSNYFSGTLITNAQPNITSVGKLVNLTIGNSTANSTFGNGSITANGNVTFNGNVSLGNISNIIITGGSSGQYIQTDGAGNLSWNSLDTKEIINGNSNVVVSANSNVSVSVNGTSNILVISTSGIDVIGYVTSNTVIANANTDSTSTTTGTIKVTGGVGVTGNVYSNNIYTSNVVISGNSLTLNSATIAVSNTGNAGIFNLSVSNISIGLSSNITLGSTSGNVTVRGNLSANGLQVIGTSNLGNILSTSIKTGIISSTANTIAVTTDTIIDLFGNTVYRTAKYIIAAKNDDGYQSMEILLVHDGNISFITTYGVLSTAIDDLDIITVSSNVVNGNICLYATGSNANTTVNLLSTYIID
jgi:hypothetical protein